MDSRGTRANMPTELQKRQKQWMQWQQWQWIQQQQQQQQQQQAAQLHHYYSTNVAPACYASPINAHESPMNGTAFLPSSSLISQNLPQQQPLQHHAAVLCLEQGQQNQLQHSDSFEDEFGEFESAEPVADSAAGSASTAAIEPASNESGLDPFADIAPRLCNVSLSPLGVPDYGVPATASSELLKDAFGEFELSELEREAKVFSAGTGTRRKLEDRILPRLAIDISLDSMISDNLVDVFSNKRMAQPQSQTGESQASIDKSVNGHSETQDGVASSSEDDWQTEWHDVDVLDSIEDYSEGCCNNKEDTKRTSTNISNSPVSGSVPVDHFASLELSRTASGGAGSSMPYTIEEIDSTSLNSSPPASRDRSTGGICLQEANLLLEQFGSAADRETFKNRILADRSIDGNVPIKLLVSLIGPLPTDLPRLLSFWIRMLSETARNIRIGTQFIHNALNVVDRVEYFEMSDVLVLLESEKVCSFFSALHEMHRVATRLSDLIVRAKTIERDSILPTFLEEVMNSYLELRCNLEANRQFFQRVLDITQESLDQNDGVQKHSRLEYCLICLGNHGVLLSEADNGADHDVPLVHPSCANLYLLAVPNSTIHSIFS